MGLALSHAVTGAAFAASVDLSVSSYTQSPDPVARNGTATFTIVVTNNENFTDATGTTTLGVKLPTNIDFSGIAAPAGCAFDLTASPKTLTCTRTGLTRLATWTVVFTGKGDTVGAVTTEASVKFGTIDTDSNDGNNELIKNTTVNNGADLTVQLSGVNGAGGLTGCPGACTAVAGSTISYTVTATNNGPDPISAIKVVDNLPPTSDFAYGSATGTNWTCSPSGTTLTCLYAGPAIAVGSAAPPITLSGQIVKATAGTITNGASVSSNDAQTGDPVPGNNGPSQVIVTVSEGTNLRANKTMVSNATGATTFETGGAVTMTLSATNTGTQSAGGVTLTDVVPTGFTIGTLPAGCAAASQTITCTVGTLAAGATSGNFVIPLTAPAVVGGGTNIASVSRSTPAAGNNTDGSVNYLVSAPFAHLTLTKTKSPNPVAAGATVTSTIKVTNSTTSTSAASGTVRVTDALSADETFQSTSSAGWTCAAAGNPQTVTCDYVITGSLARGATLPDLVILTTAGNFTGTMTNTACTGMSANSPHTPADNSTAGNCASAGVTSTTSDIVDLSIAKTASVANVPVGTNSFSYTLTVTNSGDEDVPTAVVTDALQAWYNGNAGITGGSAIITGAGAGESCTFGSTVSCTLKNLAKNTPRTITINVSRPVKDGTIANTATVTSPDAVDANTANNSASASLTIDPIADVTITGMASAPNPVKVGVELTYTTSIRNNGPSTATGVVLRHVIVKPPVAAHMSYVSGSAAIAGTTATCGWTTFAGGEEAGQSGIECTGFSLNDGEARQLIFKVIPVYPYPSGQPHEFESNARITTTSVESSDGNNKGTNKVLVDSKSIDLAVTDADTGYDPSSFGDSIVYQIVTQNNGPSQATGLKLSVTPVPPPQGTAAAPYTMVWNSAGSVLPGGATCSQPGAGHNPVICYLGADQNNSVLASNSPRTFSLSFNTGPTSNAPAGSLTYKTTAVVESFETGATPFAGDSLSANNTVSETTTVLPKTDLAVVSKTVSAGSPFAINQPFTYTVVVANLGPSPATGVIVTDVLPAGLRTTATPTAALGSGTLGVNNCTSSGSPVTVTCTLGTVPVASSIADTNNLVTITIPVKAPYSVYTGPFLQNITNTASIAPVPNTSRDPNPANNTNSVVVQISKSSIAGSVYSDNNRNAALDGGEKITSTAVTFALFGKDQWDNDIGTSGSPITVSTSTGDFLFDNLPPAKSGAGYTVRETQPSGYYQSREYLSPGNVGGTTGTDNQVAGIVLPVNTAATGYIFEEYRQATVTGYVYSDLNNNGQRASSGEPAIAGVKVRITGKTYKNVDLCSAINDCEKDTNSSGYTFIVPPSAVGESYTVTEVSQPTGYRDGLDQNGSGAGNVIGSSANRTNPESIVVGQVDPNANLTERNFGELAHASISGRVFIDSNSDAVKQTGESGGVPGVGITLSGNDYLGNSICNTVTCPYTTDSTGAYTIGSLPPSDAGGYTVTEAAPSGLTHTGAQAGNLGGTINGTNRAPGTGVLGATATSAIVLGAGVAATDYNFGAKGQGLSGFVYSDLNRNGVKDAGEPGISSVTVTLSGMTVGGGNVCNAIAPNPCSITTGADGGYNFAGLPQSNGAGYTIVEAQPTGYPDGLETLGTVTGAGGANGAISGTGPVFDQFSGIVLPIDGVGTNYNFGEWAASIAGTVYVDVDGSNGNNAGDLPLAGVTITLSGAKAATTTTDTSGNFKFTGLPAGTYTLTETQPVSYGEAANAAGTSGGTASTVANTSVISNIVVASGAEATGYLFGEKGGSLSGTVYLDANNNGTQDAAETTGIGGVTLTLTGTAADGTTTVNLTTTTAANGSYTFAGLAKANATGYTVTQTQPAAYLDGKHRKGLIDAADCTACDITTANTISKIALDPAKTFTRYDFGEVLASTIAGRVYADADNDSTYDAGEEIAGVTLTLTGNDDRGAAVNTTVTTATDGTYSFTGLRPSGAGGYAVTETQPQWIGNYAGTTGTLVGTVGGTASGTAALDVISAVVLPSGASGIEYNFRENASSIAGFVYLDSNDNGVKDASEQGIAGVVVTLTGTNTGGVTVTRTQTTGADGSYLFINLASGTYTLTETHPAAYSDGRETAGTSGGTVDNSAFDSTAPRNTIGAIGLAMGNAATGYNFGERPAPVAPTTATITGRVYIDANDNGVIDSGENGIAGVTVSLTGTSSTGSAVNMTVQTANDGTYVFSGVPAGNADGYVISETQPSAYGDGKTTKATGNPGSFVSAKPVASGTGDTIANVSVTAGARLTDYNFGELPAGTTISGFAYVDANDNGVRDAGEKGIPSVTVRLSGTDTQGKAVNLTTSTAADGSYSFTKLQPSDSKGYTITETQPTAFADGKTTVQAGNPGTASSTKPVASGAADTIGAVVLANGASLANYNFGEKASTSIAGLVYVDANDNGVKEPNETGIAGVTVKLTGTDAEGKTVNLATTTGADGGYLFANLVPSNSAGYVITETQPANYADGRTTIATGNPGSVTATKPVVAGSVDTIGAVLLASGAVLTDYNFGEKEIGNSIAGFVYADRNDNGMRDTDEPGIANITVTLTGNSAAGAPVNRTLQTGADGSFLFDRLPASGPAGYVLTETQPSMYKDGKTTLTAGNPGRADSVKPATSGNIDRVSGIVLSTGNALTGYLFGEIPVPTLKPPIVNGYVWFDRTHNRKRPVDGSHQGADGWTVQLRRNGAPICTTQTGSNGFYQFDNLHCPGYEFSGLPTGSGFSIVFTKEGSNLPAVPVSGGNRGQVPSTGGQITNITLNPTDEVVEQNLPLDPAGVVYDSMTRKPIKGAVVTIFGPPGFNPATHLVGSTAAQVQNVGDDGLYQFLLQNDFPTGVYTLTVAAPAGYLPAPSTRLPACNGAPVVGLFPDPALVQATDTAPSQSVTMQLDPANCAGMVPGGARTTQYYFGFHITNGGSAPILNNHIPLDPVTTGSLVVSKTTPMVNVARGDLVPYTITVTNIDQRPFSDIGTRDLMPPGFKYRAGSGRRDGVPVEPTVSGRQLTWPGETYAPKQKHTYTLVLAVGAGVGDGDYVNQAYAIGGGGSQVSNTGAATVRIVPDPTFDCPDVIGKVFDDRNANGYQDDGEPGIPAVRVVTARGLLVTTDAEGRFHVPCAEIPNADRGSNFVMKLDERTLPSGYRVTTENPRDVRVTRGKMVKLNFGATIHRVARIELNDQAFDTGATTLRFEWNKQMASMMEQLKTKPSVVRIAYRAGSEDKGLVKKRVDALGDEIRRRWKEVDGMYTLAIETEDAQ